ncbi:MAG: hypothetical protein IKE51_04080 [Solobacterium sp.]|nr:hypothetical protein [Solobacterium sp.]
MTQTISRLSMKRIIISLLIFALIPVVARLLNRIVDNETISLTFSLTLAGWILIMYDWNLFGIHYNRCKENLGDTILYSIVGVILIGGWVFLNVRFLQGTMLLPDRETIHRYFFASPAIIAAFTYIQAFLVNIAFKCLTDRFDIREKELLIILASGFLFGLVFTLLFTEFEIALLIRTYLYNTILVMILSYLYNQSSSFIPGIIAMGTVYLIVILI